MGSLVVEGVGLEKGCLRGRTAVITGAGRGIGKETALAFAWLGANVVIAELSESGADVERLVRESGDEAVYIQTDVSDKGSVDRLVLQTRDRYGEADILINNAILCPVARVLEMAVETWDRTIAVNLRGTFLMSQAFLPGMIANGRGAIVNMISAEAMPYLSAYIASKQGIQAFGESLAGEVGEKGIKVVSLAPGMVDTPAIREMALLLAPRMGMTAEQFMGVSLHPAYPGLMPAEHAAAAAAYLVVKLMDRYHGESVTGYEVLERAGFISSSKDDQANQGVRPDVESGQGKISAPDVSALARKFQQTIAETEAEFTKLPLFARPMARRGFKIKSGKSLQEWERLAASLFAWADCIETAQRPVLRRQLAGLEELLGQLNGYYRDVPTETGRFTRDQALLADVRRISSERIDLINSLIETLKRN